MPASSASSASSSVPAITQSATQGAFCPLAVQFVVTRSQRSAPVAHGRFTLNGKPQSGRQ
jgi:hypothetical protein